MVPQAPAPTTAAVDGRAERRERNRAAVVEALLELYREGQLAPSAEVIAARAGVSPRSIFRYFDDIDALVEEAVRQQQAHLAPRMELVVDPAEPLDRRLAHLVEARLALYEAMGPVARVARSVAPQQPKVAAELARLRAVLQEQVATAGAAELRARRGAARDRALWAADVLVSWESVDLLRAQGLDHDEVEATLVAGLRAVLG